MSTLTAPRLRRSAGTPATGPAQEGPPMKKEGPLMKKADRFLFITIVLGGSWAFGIFAIPFAILTWVYLNRAQKAGQLTRPWAVTIIGAFVLIDSSINFFGWGTDLFWSHNTGLMQTLWPGYGKLVDGAYYIDYNAGPLGGLSNYSEKTLEVMGVLVMYPMRIAACWGFLKMKRWGLQGMIVTSYVYIAFWVAYLANLYQDFPARMGASDFGNLGIWFILVVYATPFLIMPYLYIVNRDLFTDEK